jgi:hypothetical protein
MLAIGLSLPLLVVYPLFISAVLIWLNRRGVGAVGAAAGTLAVCVAVSLIQFFALGPATLSRQAVQLWLLFVCVPSAVVFGVSRFGVLQARPGWLLCLGPISFVMAVVVVMVTYNILLASSSL